MGKAGSKPEDLRTSSDAERKNRYKHSPTSHKSLDVATMLALTAQKDINVELKDKIAAAQRTKFIDLENCQLALFPGEILVACPDLTQVQLSQNQLTELPPEMATLKSLAVLRVSSNKLKTIPQEVLAAFDQLQILDISRNIFANLPKGIEKLSELARLVAHCNRITTLGVSMGALTSLNTLDLSTNQLKVFPPELLELNALKHLDINNNEIESLAGIGRLSNLVQLLCAANKLTTVPDELSKMYSLKEVDLSANQLSSLPACVSALDSLQKLNLNNNHFTQFPVEATLIPRLIRLELAENRLVSLRAEISKLNELAFLNLSGNQLTAVPPEIGQMTVLEMLDLTNNRIAALPKEIGQLIYLSQLYISRNELQVLPPEINLMSCVCDFDCLFNKLTALPPSFANTWQQIKRLSLANNRLRALPPEIGLLTKLAELDLHCNKLASLPSEITKLRLLEFLNLYRNKLKQLPEGIGALTNLGHLFLGYNQLTSLPDELQSLRKLRELFVSGNKLTSIGPLSQMYSLQDLFIAGNTLHGFPDLQRLSALRVLDVSGSKLTTVPAYLSSLYSLRELNVTYNRITSLPSEFTRLTSMKEMYIGFNRLSDGIDRLSAAMKDCMISSYANKFVQSAVPPNMSVSVSGERKKFNKRLGIAEMLGRRLTMEDTVTASLGVKWGRGRTLDFIGVFDGHGGREASIYAAQHMQKAFLRHLEEAAGAADIRACLHATFMELSRQMSSFVCGTTAVVLVLANGKIYTANVGDSRAVLCRHAQAIPITVDHTPRVPEEVQRLRALNGFVTGGRVNGILAVSRTLGDKYLHPFVNAEPYLSELEIEPEDEFIILGCDGVWDVCTNQKAIDIVRKEKHPIIASMKLRDHCYLSGSSDNISVVVVRLEPYRAGVLIASTPPGSPSPLNNSPNRGSLTGEKPRRKNVS